jgi:amino-acid N-acetyltransferase
MTGVAIDLAAMADYDVVAALLDAERLPLAGLKDHFDQMLVARDGSRIVGCAALELYEDGALLRSVAVDAPHRGTGLGSELTRAALRLAEKQGIRAVYLLTTTAERFFPRFGFEVIDRADVPSSVARSAEFGGACPSSATVMRTSLTSPR